MSALFGLLALLVLNACAGMEPPHTVQEWVGHSSDELVRSWGVPGGTYTLQTGGSMLQYSESKTETTNGTSTTQDVCTDFSFKNFRCEREEKQLVTTPPTVTNSKCDTIFTVAGNGIITSVKRQGDASGCSDYLSTYSTMPPPASPVAANPDVTGNTPYCRESNAQIFIDGKPQPAYGKKCLQPDGSWKFME